ncbi:MAG: hypothetical protein JXB15_01695 [Anaerolineales bacterium]|nr:hypothetical protein [Anaerolineales bacterium]
MSILIAFPLFAFLTIVQSVIVSRFPLLNGSTDLVLLTLIAWALQKRVRTAWHWCVIGGGMISYVSALPTGVPLGGYLLVVGMAQLLRRRVWQVPILAMLATTFLGTLLSQLISLLALSLVGASISILEAINLVILPSLLLNLLFSIPVFAIFSDMASWLYPEPLEV